MNKDQLKEVIKQIVKEVLSEDAAGDQKVQFTIDPNEKAAFVVKYQGTSVGKLIPKNPINKGDDAFGAYSDMGKADEIYKFFASDPRFKRFDNAESSLKKHARDLTNLVTMRLEKGLPS